jgi:alpha,alpha-trehalose phosphorylase
MNLKGATLPWRTIRGEECSGYWPAGTAAMHVNADVAAAVRRYVDAVEDPLFVREVGAELLTESARLWLSLGHLDDAGRFRIDGVTGPDEYSALVDNNVYTNLMAQANLTTAARCLAEHEDIAAQLGVSADEIRAWRAAAEAMYLPFDDARGIHPQDQDFLAHEVWNFRDTPPDHYPLLLHYPYFELYRKQVVKQPDLVLALQTRGEAFTLEQRRRNFDYYETITVRDSSLAAATSSIVAADVGHLDLAYDYMAEAALMDLGDLEDNASDGLHLAALGGAVMAAVAGLGGLRDHGGRLSFRPCLPAGLHRLQYSLRYRGRRLVVRIHPAEARYALHEGEPLEIHHYGAPLTVERDSPVVLPIPAAPSLPRPRQPDGRAPQRRAPALDTGQATL